MLMLTFGEEKPLKFAVGECKVSTSILMGGVCLTSATARGCLIFPFINHVYHYCDSSLTYRAKRKLRRTPAVINSMHFKNQKFGNTKAEQSHRTGIACLTVAANYP